MAEFVARQAERQHMSQFNQRSDSAANRLRDEINRQQGTNLEPQPVAVGPDGHPAAPPPPPGSYARQAYDRVRAEEQQAATQAHANMQGGQPSQQQVVGDQPPAGTPEQQSDGSVAPPLTGGQQGPAIPEDQSQSSQISENANRRIQQLITELRDKDHQIAELTQRSTQFDGLQKQVEDLMKERDRFLQQGLDELDPETRAAIFAESRFQQMLDQNNARLMEAFEKRVAPLQEQTHQSELDRLAKKYPGFDMTIHPSLMDQFRAKHPGLTMEMAFKAVAEGDEAIPRDVAQQVAVPPVVPANNGNQLPRYMPEPQPNPEDELRDFQRRANDLLRSTDPVERRQGQRLQDEVLKERLSGASYAGKPGVFGP